MSSNEVTHRKHAEDFGRFLKSQWVEKRPALGKTVGFRLLVETFVAGATRVGGGQMKKPE